ncbi:TPA: hypothetical protein I7676_10270 [Vibrio vulnificus]|nr:hypothetical protein D8T60_15200 [Vibrio vulnificus]RZR55588.1 hypothetical protein D8T34_14680 [Vibrio vulnificus]HAS8136028.1 hypothetical protein [Vibrio vulnificus]HAS8215982.1 hypothetical protein [Vibrio vulnificus]HAS8297739.1 hypothetical protein [Vibrio vulnificus]
MLICDYFDFYQFRRLKKAINGILITSQILNFFKYNGLIKFVMNSRFYEHLDLTIKSVINRIKTNQR